MILGVREDTNHDISTSAKGLPDSSGTPQQTKRSTPTLKAMACEV